MNNFNSNLEPIPSFQAYSLQNNQLGQSSINKTPYQEQSINNPCINPLVIIDYKKLYEEQKLKTKKLITIQKITEASIVNAKNSKNNQQITNYQQKIKIMANNCQKYQNIIQEMQNRMQNQAKILQRKKTLQIQSRLILEQENKILKQELQQKNRMIGLLKSKLFIKQQKQNDKSAQEERNWKNNQTSSLQSQIIDKKLEILKAQIVKVTLQNQQLKKIQQIYYKERDQSNDQINRLNKHITNLTSSSQKQFKFYKHKLQQLSNQLIAQRQLKSQLKQTCRRIQIQNNQLLEHICELQNENISIKTKLQRHQKELQMFQSQQKQIYSQLQKSKLQIQDLKASKQNMIQQIKWYRTLVQQIKCNYINSQLEKQQISNKLKKQNLQKSKRTKSNYLNQTAITQNLKFSQSTYSNRFQLNQNQMKQNIYQKSNQQKTNSRKIKNQSAWSNLYQKKFQKKRQNDFKFH